MEAYHLSTTHPEAAPFNGDVQTQYDIWTGTRWPTARNANCAANPAVTAPAEATSYTAGQMYAQTMKAWHFPEAELPTLDPAQDIRAQLGRWHRLQFEANYGRATKLSDAELMDSFLYYAFPHSAFWPLHCFCLPRNRVQTPHRDREAKTRPAFAIQPPLPPPVASNWPHPPVR